MGGDGSGRHADPVKSLLGFNQPAPTDNAVLYIPNYSGLQEGVKKTDADLHTVFIPMSLSGGFITTASGSQLMTAYTHSQDNTQAHSDYMLNTGDTATGDYYFGTTLILSGSRVGIGTLVPDRNLQIIGDTNGVEVATTSATTRKAIFMTIRNSDNVGQIDVYDYSTGPMNLNLNPNGGNVGIQTNVATNPLQVEGSICCSGSGVFKIKKFSGINTTITTADLVGKTITVSGGIITGYA